MIRTLLTSFLILFASVANAEGIRSGEQAAIDFSINDIKIGSTVAAFKKSFPNALRLKPYNEAEVADYSITHKKLTKIVNCFRGKVYRIAVAFSKQNLKDIGGAAVLAKKIGITFGPANGLSDTETQKYRWLFPEAKRRVDYWRTETGLLLLVVTDTSVEKKLTHQRAENLDIGF